jgi:hypothetical protein
VLASIPATPSTLVVAAEIERWSGVPTAT